MHRRDIFNMLLGKTADKPLTTETVSPVGMPEPLDTADTKLFSDDYQYVYANQHIGHDLIATYPFELTVYHTKDSDVDTTISVGRIEFGIDESGYLYVGDYRSKQMLKDEQLKEYYQLILSVHPIDRGFSHARLKLIDEAGLTLAILKTGEVMQEHWAGHIEIKGNGVNRLNIQGRKKITI